MLQAGPLLARVGEIDGIRPGAGLAVPLLHHIELGQGEGEAVQLGGGGALPGRSGGGQVCQLLLPQPLQLVHLHSQDVADCGVAELVRCWRLQRSGGPTLQILTALPTTS